MKVIYVAGPYRGANAWEREQNIRRAELLAFRVWASGFVALCPHTNTRHFDGTLPDETWLAGDIEMLKRCDGVILTQDWEQSSGAKAEADIAAKLGIPIFHSIIEMTDFFTWATPGHKPNTHPDTGGMIWKEEKGEYFGHLTTTSPSIARVGHDDAFRMWTWTITGYLDRDFLVKSECFFTDHLDAQRDCERVILDLARGIDPQKE